jgi:hypothetical protein
LRAEFLKAHEYLNELTHRHSFQPSHILKQREDLLDSIARETRFRVGSEFFHEQRNAFGAAASREP